MAELPLGHGRGYLDAKPRSRLACQLAGEVCSRGLGLGYDMADEVGGLGGLTVVVLRLGQRTLEMPGVEH